MFHHRAGGDLVHALAKQSKALDHAAHGCDQHFLISHLSVSAIAARKRNTRAADNRYARGLAPTNIGSALDVYCELWTYPPAYNLPMTRFSHGVLPGLALFALIGCGRAPQPAVLNAAKSAAPSEPLGRIVERYWAERVDTEDVIAPQSLADALNVERRYLAEVLGVARDGLDADSRLTYDIFRRQRGWPSKVSPFPASCCRSIRSAECRLNSRLRRRMPANPLTSAAKSTAGCDER